MGGKCYTGNYIRGLSGHSNSLESKRKMRYNLEV